LYFKNDNNPYPVEIKWKSSEFNKPNQIAALKKNNGFLVSFDEPSNKDLSFVKIDTEDFQKWLIERIQTLWEESLSTRVETKTGSKTWVVTLRGKKAYDNFIKMKLKCKTSSNFWAFKNDLKAMANILNLEKGDEMIFLFVKTSGNERSAMMPDSTNEIDLMEAYFTKIEDPYYVVLEGENSKIFEKEPLINKRIWPHFFDFKRIEDFDFINSIKLSRRQMTKELRARIADSANHGGVLMEISKVDSSNLKAQIRKYQKSEKKSAIKQY
jgi:hypothetical protein